jgi:uncharacterized protein YyaL (SSP411 family)
MELSLKYRRAVLRSCLGCLAALGLVLLVSVSCPAQESASPGTTADQLRTWGLEALAISDEELWLADRGLYAELRRRRQRGELQPAFMWSAGVQLTALAAAARLEPEAYRDRLLQYAESLQAYWKERDGIGGYDVLPPPNEPDRYYDDNAWIVLALVEIYEVQPDEKYLDRAENALKFVLSGEDDVLGGGVYWRERDKKSKNACSNAPTVAAALRVFQKRSDPKWRAAADRIFEWTRQNLQADDGLIWDNRKLDGELEEQQYSYNTALMIRACCLFYEITGERQWLEEAQRLARAAEAKWVEPETGAIKDGGSFAHMLVEALLAVYEIDGDPRWRRLVEHALVYLHDKVRDPEGRYDHSWDEPTRRRLWKFRLIDQASAARAFLVAAEAFADAPEATSLD